MIESAVNKLLAKTSFLDLENGNTIQDSVDKQKLGLKLIIVENEVLKLFKFNTNY